VMEEFNIQGKQTSFYKCCPGTFGYTLILHRGMCVDLSAVVSVFYGCKTLDNEIEGKG